MQKKFRAKIILTFIFALFSGNGMAGNPGGEAPWVKNLQTLLETKSCFGCDLKGADLSHQVIRVDSLYGIDFTGADLSGTVIYAGEIRYVDFSEVIFDQTYIHSGHITGSLFNNSRIKDSTFFLWISHDNFGIFYNNEMKNVRMEGGGITAKVCRWVPAAGSQFIDVSFDFETDMCEFDVEPAAPPPQRS